MSETPTSEIRSLIELLGDGSAVADSINEMLPIDVKKIERDSVYKMKETGAVPHKWRIYLARIAIAKGRELPNILQEYSPASAPSVPSPEAA